MTNEEFQKLVLEELRSLKNGQQELRQDISGVKSEMSDMNERLSNVEGQSSETNQIVKALIHEQEVNTAKLDGLVVNTASKEAVSRIEQEVNSVAEDMSFLLRKTIKHDDDIRQLRKAE